LESDIPVAQLDPAEALPATYPLPIGNERRGTSILSGYVLTVARRLKSDDPFSEIVDQEETALVDPTVSRAQDAIFSRSEESIPGVDQDAVEPGPWGSRVIAAG
jgi:hypothetical protein